MGLPLRGWLVTGFISFSSVGAVAADSKSFPPCTTAPTEADRKAAQGAFAAGQGSFNEADYATAITYWRDAYRRDCTAHLLLLNLARAYELKGDRPEAVTALETYLQRKPDAGDADQIKRRIENLKAQMASSTPAPAASTTAAPTTAATGPTAALPPPESGESRGRSRSAVPLVLSGVGGVLAIVGILQVTSGASKVSDAEAKCPVRNQCHDPDAINTGNDGRKQETTGGILLGVGIAAAAGGVIWYFASAPPTGSGQAHSGLDLGKRASLAPAVLPGFAGVSLAGTF
jgi:hypothetical protein